MLTLVPGAQAAVTTSSITTPADGTLLFQNADTNPTQTFTVSGTSNGTTGDFLNIDCYQGGAYAGESYQHVAVAADGSFTAQIPQGNFGGSCELLAPPNNIPAPTLPTGYTGPRVAFNRFATSKIGGTGANAADPYDFYFVDATPTGYTQLGSIDDCGPYQQVTDGSASMTTSPPLLYCAGSFYNSSATFASTTSPDLTRSEILVDGQNAYGSYSADTLWSNSTGASTNNSGFPALSATLDRFNPANADAQTTDTESLVECAPNDVYNPAAADCSSFTPSGVKIQRVTAFSGGGRVATVTDTYTSTDSKPHTLDLEYETDLNKSAVGWELPGEASFSPHSTGDTAAAPPSAPGTIYTISDRTTTSGISNPVAAMTFASPYSSIRFDNTLWSSYPEMSGLIDYQRTVPAGGSTTISWSYATESSLSAAQADASAAQAKFAAAVSIGSPAAGATLGVSPVTVSGTLTAPSGVQSVTVNGIAAAVSGSNWAASVPLTKGPNTIVATLTTAAGSTATATEHLTYAPVAPTAVTGAATNVSGTGARLTGTVTPGTAIAAYHFEYGPTRSYGTVTPAVALSAGSSAVAVAAQLAHLTAGTTYHYRLVAISALGTSNGSDRTFVPRAKPRRLTASVRPSAARRPPFKFKLSGRLVLPAGVAAGAACRGSVSITVRHGKRTLARRRVRHSRRCTYSAAVSVSARKLHGSGRITFTAAFGGNRVLLSRRAHSVSVRFG
jgi:hypothetical protein